jgi:beta-alanine--pyruvate transaminase
VNDDIHDAIMDACGPDYMIEFPHGYTYSAHPAACAAGIAALDVLQKENMIERVRCLAPHFEAVVHSLKGSSLITDIRNFGLAAGITLAAYFGEARRSYEIGMACWQKGLYVRFDGDRLRAALFSVRRRILIDWCRSLMKP